MNTMKIQSNEKIETLKNKVKGQIVLPDDPFPPGLRPYGPEATFKVEKDIQLQLIAVCLKLYATIIHWEN